MKRILGQGFLGAIYLLMATYPELAVAKIPVVASANGIAREVQTKTLSVSFHKTDTGPVARSGIPRTYSDWKTLVFSVSEQGDATISGPAADPDADGTVNLLEYAFSLNPMLSDRSGLPTIGADLDAGVTFTTITFLRRRDTGDLAYTVQASADLFIWSDADIVETGHVDLGTSEMVTVRDGSVLSGGSRRFLRVLVSSRAAGYAATTDPLGAVAMKVQGVGTAPSGRLNLVGLPLTEPVVYQGKISSVSGSTLVQSGSTWGDDAFNGANGTYFVEIASGTNAGLMLDIVATSASAHSLTLGSSVASYASVGDVFKVRRHWTLADVFGATNAAGLIAGALNTADLVQVYVPSTQTYTSYYYSSGGAGGTGWRSDASVSADAAATPLYFDEGFLVRKQAAALTWILTGAVKTGPTILTVAPGTNFLPNVYPAGTLTLSGSQIYTGSPTTGLAGGSLTTADLVNIHNPTTGIYANYYYKTIGVIGGTGWRANTSPSADASSTTLPIGGSVLLQRKAAGTFMWHVPQPSANAFYNGATPTLSILSGNDQSADIEQFNAQPFEVAVFNAAGTTPLVSAPVTFSVTQGSGLLATTTTGSPSLLTSLNLRTDIDGTARVYYRQPPAVGVLSQVTATAGTAQVTFGTTSTSPTADLDGNGLPDSWEKRYFGHTGVDPTADSDTDRLTNLQEYQAGSNPTNPDSNGDGFSDWQIHTGFEAAEGYAAGVFGGGKGWFVTGGSALISAAAHAGTQALALPVASTPESAIEASREVPTNESDHVVYLDLWIKPVVADGYNWESPTVDTGTALLSFARDDQGQGVVLAARYSEGVVFDSTGSPFPLDANGRAANWIRLTIRHDYDANQTDLSVDGKLVSANRYVVLQRSDPFLLTVSGATTGTGDTLVDDVYVGPINPLATDMDNDGMPDSWEAQNGLDPTRNDREEDPDQDGLSNIEEFRLGTNPRMVDTDGDKLTDGWEAGNGLDPAVTNADIANADGDADGLPLWREIQLGSDPANADSDGDGMSDGWEVQHGLEPTQDDRPLDLDGDGIANFAEYQAGTAPDDYYNGTPPTITFTQGGDGQLGAEGEIAVLVTSAAGQPLGFAPVVFSVSEAGLALATTPMSSVLHTTCTVRTGPDGIARVYPRRPSQ